MTKSIAEIVLLVLGAALAVVLAVVIGPLMSAAAGYFTGWVLSALFPFAGHWIVSGCSAIGVSITIGQLPAIGSVLGFTGAFFKATQTNKVEK